MFANIYPEGVKTGVTTNEYGFFSITLPEGKYQLVFSYIGYQTIKNEITLDKDLYQNFALSPRETKIAEITVVSQPKTDFVRKNEIGAVRLNVKELSVVPILFGEQDILKSIQLMPGVSPVLGGRVL